MRFSLLALSILLLLQLPNSGFARPAPVGGSTAIARPQVRWNLGRLFQNRRQLLSRRFEGTMLGLVKQHNRALRRGKPGIDISRVFCSVGKALEHSGGEESIAIQAARKSARRSRGCAASAKPMSRDFQRALKMAIRLHNNQTRKGSKVPYVSHLLGVAGIVMAAGGSEREAICALLHDAVEDQGGQRTLRRIQRRFGGGIAGVVGELSEKMARPWKQRKLGVIRHVRAGELSASARTIKLADCIYNSGTMMEGIKREGDGFWKIFHGGKEGTLWYYRGLVDAFKQSPADPSLVKRLSGHVTRMHQLSGVSLTAP